MSNNPTPAAVAARLHAVADAIAALSPDLPEIYAALTLSDSSRAKLDDNAKRQLVDTLSRAVLGTPGKLTSTRMTAGTLWYGAESPSADPVSVSIYGTVANPAEKSEIERLRAELAEVRAERNRAVKALADGI